MKLGLWLLLTLVVAFHADAADLTCSIDFYRAPTSGGDRGAVVGGWVKTDSPGPVFISLKNAGINYTTVAGRDGRWAVYFKLLSTRASAEAWVNQTEPVSACAGFSKFLD